MQWLNLVPKQYLLMILCGFEINRSGNKWSFSGTDTIVSWHFPCSRSDGDDDYDDDYNDDDDDDALRQANLVGTA